MLIIHEPYLKEFAKLLEIDLKCSRLQLDISEFSNGEFEIPQIQSCENHTIVLFSKSKNINTQLLKLFLILGNLKKFEIIDIFVPYIPYSRQDDSFSFKTVLDIIKSLGVRKIFTIDIHKITSDPAIINILPYELISPAYKKENLVVVAPDKGAIHRAKTLSDFFKTDLITIEKVSGQITNGHLANGRRCLIVDDIVDSGKTIAHAKSLLYSCGAKEVIEWISDNARISLEKYHKPLAEIISRAL